ncbi:MAG: hypothetical protein JSS50_02460 [Proteobacteria bacterium]|nr:hypothetical protein [Pseudomonadota bacterium]
MAKSTDQVRGIEDANFWLLQKLFPERQAFIINARAQGTSFDAAWDLMRQEYPINGEVSVNALSSQMQSMNMAGNTGKSTGW